MKTEIINTVVSLIRDIHITFRENAINVTVDEAFFKEM
jgi:hypothetical protein